MIPIFNSTRCRWWYIYLKAQSAARPATPRVSGPVVKAHTVGGVRIGLHVVLAQPRVKETQH